MLGWEFPPYFAGGVGTVCHELTKGLAKQGVHVTYIMPKGPDNVHSDHVRLLVANKAWKELGIKYRGIDSILTPYVSKEEYGWNLRRYGELMGDTSAKLYGENLLEEMQRFAHAVVAISQEEDFDVIHAHDWTTVPAAIAVKNATGKPMIMHVHITEFDKTGGEHADSEVYRIEYEGFHAADKVIAVSNFVKQRLIERYYVPASKIVVIHNAVEGGQMHVKRERLSGEDKLVLFLGRVTLQKGPDYFLEAAGKVAALIPNVKFIIAGTGDMLPEMIERAASLGIGNRVIFTGFVSRDEGDKLYRMADLFVMPSVSEPFGIVPLEAMKQGTPVIISKQSGVSEVIHHALKVDFWDVEQLANKIVAALSYPVLHETLQEHTNLEIKSFTWDNPALECKRLYERII